MNKSEVGLMGILMAFIPRSESVGLLYLFAVWLSHINQKYFSINHLPSLSDTQVSSLKSV